MVGDELWISDGGSEADEVGEVLRGTLGEALGDSLAEVLGVTLGEVLGLTLDMSDGDMLGGLLGDTL